MKEKMNVETRTLERVTEGEHKHWLSVALIEAGVMICVPSLMLGGILAGAMPMSSAFLAGGIGYVLAVLFTAVMGMQGQDLGVPLCVISLSSFGKKGGKAIVTTLLILSLMGWFAVQAKVCGDAFSGMLEQFLQIHIPSGVSIAIWGVIMLVTAVYGIDALKGLNTAAVPALILVTMLGCFLAVRSYGIDGFRADVPQTMSVMEGMALTFSFLSTGMVIAPDYTRYNKTRGQAAKSMIFGILPAGLMMLFMGAVMSKLTGLYDISVILCELGIPVLGLVVLILATWTSNTTNAYSAGISIVMLMGLKDNKRAASTVVAGLAGTIMALVGVANYFEQVLSIMGYAFAPIAGVMIAEYWIIMRGRPEKWQPVDGVNWIGVLSWIIGVAATLLISIGVPVINGMIAAALALIALRRLVDRRTAAQPAE